MSYCTVLYVLYNSYWNWLWWTYRNIGRRAGTWSLYFISSRGSSSFPRVEQYAAQTTAVDPLGDQVVTPGRRKTSPDLGAAGATILVIILLEWQAGLFLIYPQLFLDSMSTPVYSGYWKYHGLEVNPHGGNTLYVRSRTLAKRRSKCGSTSGNRGGIKGARRSTR